jgi:hypothetical protein
MTALVPYSDMRIQSSKAADDSSRLGSINLGSLNEKVTKPSNAKAVKAEGICRKPK